MTVLYIYPHPDDESFGPAPAMHKFLRDAHEVHLLTLTQGGATKQRYKYRLSVDEMGEVRHKEMLEVEKVLGLSSMTVLDLPDGGLKEMDPLDIEALVEVHIEELQPHVVVTYPAHGISGFHDHLVTHAVVKRVFVELKGDVPNLQRLAFQTITEEHAATATHFALSHSTEAEIDCLLTVSEEDLDAGRRALDCYVTFQETIEKTGIKNMLSLEAPFEIYQEEHTPPLTDLFAGLS